MDSRTSILTVGGSDDELKDLIKDTDSLKFTGFDHTVETFGGHKFSATDAISDLGITDVEVIEPDTVSYVYSSPSKLPDVPASTIMEMCGPGKKYPNLWVGYECMSEDDLWQLQHFEKEYLDQVCPKGTLLSDADEQIVGEAHDLYDAANYAADNQRWALASQNIHKAQEMLIKAFPHIFPNNRATQPAQEKEFTNGGL